MGMGKEDKDKIIHCGLMEGHSVRANTAVRKLRQKNSLQLPNRHTEGLMEKWK